MGYAVQNFWDIAELVSSAGLTGKRVIDLGSQDVKIFGDADLMLLQECVQRLGGDPARIRKLVVPPYPVVISARDVFEAAGYDYICCDVDQRPGTIYVDFNTLAFDRSLYGKFDFVMNAGTTEHLPNPLAAFFLMHELCASGGLLFNEVPFSGWTNHGLNNLTAKFWHTLRWMNSYRVLLANVKYVPDNHPLDGNFGGEHLAFIDNLSKAAAVSSSIEIIFQKTDTRGFVPPYDAVFPTDDGGKAIGQLVMGSLRPFIVNGSLTDKQAEKTVNQFLAYQGLGYKYSPDDDMSLPGSGNARLRFGRFLPSGLRNSPTVASVARMVRGEP